MVWWWWIIPGFVAVIGLAVALSGLGWMFRGRPFKGGRGVFGGALFLGIGAIIAIVGGIMYLVVVLASVFLGKRMEARRLTLLMAQANPLVEDALPNIGKEAHGKLAPQGTFAIVFVFLAVFAVYYFTNWWLLGRTWYIR